MAVGSSVILGVLYLLGGRRPVRLLDARRHHWTGRQWRATAFFGGLGLVAVVLSAPVDAFARASMATRTAQLVALVMLVAPLIVLGAPEPRFRRLVVGRSHPPRRPVLLPVLAFLLFNGGILLACLPAVYRTTANPGLLRELGQLVLLGLACFFWSQVIAQPPGHCQLSHIGRVVYLFLSSAQLRILGVILGFAAAPFYPVPLVDQQIAAGILMVPGVLTDLVVLTVCLYLWLGQDDRRQVRRQQFEPRAG
jgi:cytochrome c oxidase assembly factor CtaG